MNSAQRVAFVKATVSNDSVDQLDLVCEPCSGCTRLHVVVHEICNEEEMDSLHRNGHPIAEGLPFSHCGQKHKRVEKITAPADRCGCNKVGNWCCNGATIP